jgi:ubiquinone/menaquinone biosynthesis C-methylase UbiE
MRRITMLRPRRAVNDRRIKQLETDKVFAGSIPKLYEQYIVPLIFEPYAADLAKRLQSRRPRGVLEIAAGTGVVTRAMDSVLAPDVSIVATDLNPAMIEQARVVGTKRAVEWRQADAMQLPFGDATFDAVACQFGVMFFPDKAKAFAEALRVLKPGGVFIFSTWDRIEENEFADVIMAALATVFPDDPPRFMARTPHGYHDRSAIARDLAGGGFSKPAEVATIAARSRAKSAREPAIAYCQGTPWRSEIEARAAAKLDEATDAAEQAIVRRFGKGPVDGKIQAHVITVERP